jgi:protein O-mannosyl-transferase
MSKNQTIKKAGKQIPSSDKKKTVKTPEKTNKTFYFSLLIFAFGFVLYGASINYGYVLDDGLVNTSNRYVQEGLKGIPKIMTHGYLEGTLGENNLYGWKEYRPMLMVQLALEKEFFGLKPSVNHFFNVFYYSITGVLLFLLLMRLFKKSQPLIPFLVTLLFMAHPIHTEVVANIKSRDEILCFMFLLMSLLSLLKYLSLKKIKFFLLSLFCFFLALLSKENAITFLAIIPLILYCFTEEKIKRIALLSLPYIGIAVLFFGMIAVLIHGTISNIDPLYNFLIGISSNTDRLATTLLIMGKYILLLLYPNHLSWDYSYNQIPVVGFTNIYVIVSIVTCISLVIYALLKLRNRSIISFGILFFFIAISATSNLFILTGAAMAERFLFIPALGFCIILVFLLSMLFKRSNSSLTPVYVISGVLLVCYSFKTFDREKDWKDNLSLYEAGVKDAPNSSQTHTFLANEYSTKAQAETDQNNKAELFKKAESEFKTGLEIYPKNPQAWYNLGVLYFAMGNIPEAEKANKEVVKYNPLFAKAYNNLGVIEGQRGDFKAAVENFKKAADIDSNYFDAFSNTAAAYFNLKEYKNAEPYYKHAHELNPQSKSVNDQMIENEKRLSQEK